MDRRSAIKKMGKVLALTASGILIPKSLEAGIINLVTGDIPKYDDYERPSRKFAEQIFSRNGFSESFEFYFWMPPNSFSLNLVLYKQEPLTAEGYFRISKNLQETTLEMRLKSYEIENPEKMIENKQIILSQRSRPNPEGKKLYTESEFDFVLDSLGDPVEKENYNEKYLVDYPTAIDIINYFFQGQVQSTGVEFAGQKKILQKYNLQVCQERNSHPYDAVFTAHIINRSPKVNNIKVFCYKINGRFFPAELWADYGLNAPGKPSAVLKAVLKKDQYTKK